MAKAVLVAAPASGSGKTLVTLGTLRAMRDRGLRVASVKVGPDYIDPGFHQKATGIPCPSLDLWAMGEARCRSILTAQGLAAETVVVEGVMGLFDGPHGAKGSTADVASALSLPVVLVVDCRHQAQSVAALVHGFSSFRRDIHIAGIVLNRVASARHEMMLRAALDPPGPPIIAVIPGDSALQWPSRHLGLVQAREQAASDAFIERAASTMEAAGLPDALQSLAAPIEAAAEKANLLPPLGQRIAVANDEAFSFCYPAILQGWQRAGAEISFFSPLSDEQPDAGADAVFLPGGYPELHAGRIAANQQFLASLRNSKALIYGECGGYMVLGEALVDAAGEAHAMSGLLPLVTSFRERRLHLGYRRLEPHAGPWQTPLRAHEFHYSTTIRENDAKPLFKATDVTGAELGTMGLQRGKVMGSFAHVIASEAA